MTALPQNESVSQDALLRALTSAAETRAFQSRKRGADGPMSVDELTDVAYDVSMALTAISAIVGLVEGQVCSSSPLPREAHEALHGVALLAKLVHPNADAMVHFIESVTRDLSDSPQPGDAQD